MSLLTKEDTVLVAIDFQEKLMPAMSGREDLEKNVVKLVQGLREFNVPMIFTQQYTKGLGETVAPVKEAAGDSFSYVEKYTFSCMKNVEFIEKLKASGKKNVVLCGIEAHICVLQTVLQLMSAGFNVNLVVDCISSRSEENKLWAVTRMGEEGAVITTYESVLYELLGDAKAPEFKAISRIVK